MLTLASQPMAAMPPDPSVPSPLRAPLPMMAATPALREEVSALTAQNLAVTLRTTEGVRLTTSLTDLHLTEGEPAVRLLLRRADTDSPLSKITLPMSVGLAMLVPSLIAQPVAVLAEARRHPTAGYGMQLFFAFPRVLCDTALEAMGVAAAAIPAAVFTPWDDVMLVQGNLMLLDRHEQIVGDELASRAAAALQAFCGAPVTRVSRQPHPRR